MDKSRGKKFIKNLKHIVDISRFTDGGSFSVTVCDG